MPLTPTDVANKQFKVAFRGYSLDEVDAFLDEVESELTRLLRDNDGLRTGSGGERPAAADLSKAPAAKDPEPTPAPAPATTPTPTPTETQAPAAAATAGPAARGSRAAATEDGPTGALRMLQLAQQTADQLVGEASAEADTLRESARAEAAAALAAAREHAAALRAEADSQRAAADAEAQQVQAGLTERRQAAEAEIAEQRAAALGQLDTQRAQLEAQIEQLRSFEREYRGRLRDYFTGQLRHLDGEASEPPAPDLQVLVGGPDRNGQQA